MKREDLALILNRVRSKFGHVGIKESLFSISLSGLEFFFVQNVQKRTFKTTLYFNLKLFLFFQVRQFSFRYVEIIVARYKSTYEEKENWLKLIYSEKATKFCEISTVDLTVTT